MTFDDSRPHIFARSANARFNGSTSSVCSCTSNLGPYFDGHLLLRIATRALKVHRIGPEAMRMESSRTAENTVELCDLRPRACCVPHLEEVAGFLGL